MHVTLMIMSRRSFLRRTVNKYLDIQHTVKEQTDVLLPLSLSHAESLPRPPSDPDPPSVSLSRSRSLSLSLYIYI